MRSKEYLEDFLADEEFIRWVKNADPELEEFWAKWSTYHPEMREVMLLAKEIILSFGEGVVEPQDKEANEAKEEILKQLLTSPKSNIAKEQRIKGNKGGNMFNGFLKAAAVLIICFGLSLLAYLLSTPSDQYLVTNSVVKENKKGRKQTYLPDGTMVWLNSRTKVTYNANWEDCQIREVFLDGEAYFKVKEDSLRPFIVKSKNFSTTALGTAFNISAYPDDNNVVVSLQQGKVEVKDHRSKASGSYILSPGTQLIYSTNDQKVNIQPFDAEVELGWIKGVLLFKNAGFDEVMSALEKFYTISVKLEGMEPEWNYTGRFANASLEQVLERLVTVEQFKFKLKEEKLIIWIE